MSRKLTALRRLLLLARAIRVQRNWFDQLREGLRLARPKTLEFRLRNGWIVGGRRGTIDRATFNEVWLERIYELPGFNWNRCHTIIDVGAHIGSASLYFLHRAPHARVIALEPAPQNAAYLCRNIERNYLSSSITAVEAAVADQSGDRSFLIMKSTGGNSFFAYEPGGTSVQVRTLSLADVFRQHNIERCSLLKLDCEGAEYEILYALSDDMLDRIDSMAIECHRFSYDPKATPDALKAFLHSHGFQTCERDGIHFATRFRSSQVRGQ